MINEEIKLILNDMLFHTKETLKFLRHIEKGTYNAYLDDLITYTLCTEEDIKTIENYILKLEIEKYETLSKEDFNGY